MGGPHSRSMHAIETDRSCSSAGFLQPGWFMLRLKKLLGGGGEAGLCWGCWATGWRVAHRWFQMSLLHLPNLGMWPAWLGEKLAVVANVDSLPHHPLRLFYPLIEVFFLPMQSACIELRYSLLLFPDRFFPSCELRDEGSRWSPCPRAVAFVKTFPFTRRWLEICIALRSEGR